MSSAAQDEVDALFNQPEKYGRHHPEDASQSGGSSDSASDNDVTVHSDFGDADTLTSNIATMPPATYHIPQGTIFDANTGPKGVIADAQSFDKARKRSFRGTLQALSNGQTPAARPAHKTSPGSREKSSSPELSADDEEDEFMRTWRASRMNELRAGEHDTRTRRLSPSKRKYGSVETVDAVGYLDAVEKVPVDTVVVVCVYDHESSVSGLVEDALRQLARTHVTTRFVKLHYLDAEMDEVAVPAILAYRGGDLFANLSAVIEEIPMGLDMGPTSLESVLKKHQVLS
ncbi:Thioredoxin-like fold [Lasallia pustulata]|uniref:Thioredoxin-like fold n=1 Tax=Lasallia pustulata TaxID=136370 RepID=A0A1W5D5K4_9LECA|nr:Thioredoxin-like fold [Lasallia pustulata]